MKEEVKSLWEQAKVDLRTAENSLNSGDYYASVFWCQQAIEKSLKAVLVKKTNRLIKIHDLIILGRKINLPRELSKKCEKVSRAYIETRYWVLDSTTPYKKFNKNNSLEYLIIAKEIIKWVEKNI